MTRFKACGGAKALTEAVKVPNAGVMSPVVIAAGPTAEQLAREDVPGVCV